MWILSSSLTKNSFLKILNFKILQAAKESKALEAAKLNLEKQVEELSEILETEKRMRVIYLFIVYENAKSWNWVPHVLFGYYYFTDILTVLVHYDIEEAKTRENEKLQCALEEMEIRFEETKAELIQELEAAKKVAEQTPTILENNAADNELIDKLTAENEELKVTNSQKSDTFMQSTHRWQLGWDRTVRVW